MHRVISTSVVVVVLIIVVMLTNIIRLWRSAQMVGFGCAIYRIRRAD